MHIASKTSDNKRICFRQDEDGFTITEEGIEYVFVEEYVAFFSFGFEQH